LKLRRMLVVGSGLLCGVLLLGAPAFGDPEGFVRVAPEEVKWRDLPGYEGVKFAVIDGDPSKPGVYVVRVKFPPGIMSRLYFHPDDRLTKKLMVESQHYSQ